jgi:hypothetical protein
MSRRTSPPALFPPEPEAESCGKGHGRLEVRRIWTRTAEPGYPDFPHVAQVARIERERTVIRTGETSREVAYVITSLPPEHADAARLLVLNRGHWGIENRLHYVRDWSFDEDRSTIRTGTLPWTMATLRNLAIALLRLAGVTNIAAKVRELAALPHRAVALMGM